MRICWLGFATRYLACAVSVSRNSGFTSLLSKSKYTTRFASGLLGSSSGLTWGAGVAAAGAGVATVAGAGAVTAAGATGLTFLAQPTASKATASAINTVRNIFM